MGYGIHCRWGSCEVGCVWPGTPPQAATNPVHLTSLSCGRCSPLRAVPQKRMLLIGPRRESTIIQLKPRCCIRGDLIDPVCGMPKLSCESMHGPFSSSLHNIFGVKKGSEALFPGNLSRNRFRSHIAVFRNHRGGRHTLPPWWQHSVHRKAPRRCGEPVVALPGHPTHTCSVYQHRVRLQPFGVSMQHVIWHRSYIF